jgi:SAM-dependent methyltransferase
MSVAPMAEGGKTHAVADPRMTVRSGYDRMGGSYLSARPGDGLDVALLEGLVERLPPAGVVLDAGCGAGYPVMTCLANGGFTVIGIDLSAGQLTLARSTSRRPPVLVQGDLSAVPIADRTVDGVVSYYAIIHVPRSEHPTVFAETFRILRPGGVALLCVGWDDKPHDADAESWLGVPMYWSHFDADTNLGLIADTGFRIEWSRRVPDPMEHASHLFVLASRPHER